MLEEKNGKERCEWKAHARRMVRKPMKTESLIVCDML
jgi:hypothetical protein